MQFSDTTNYDGLVQDCERKLVSADYGYFSGDATRLKTVTNYINRAMDTVSVALLMSDGRWEFDDYNNTTTPVGRTDLNSGQEQYSLDTSYIVIDKVVVKDSAGNGHELTRIGIDEIHGDPEESMEGGGIPTHFDLRGSNIYLYPEPNYSYTDGLVVYFRRKMVGFTSGDTTDTPGFAASHHETVSLVASASYAEDNNMETAENLRSRADAAIASLRKFTAKRGRDSATVIRPRPNRYR
jgi:hypothetical protein